MIDPAKGASRKGGPRMHPAGGTVGHCRRPPWRVPPQTRCKGCPGSGAAAGFRLLQNRGFTIQDSGRMARIRFGLHQALGKRPWTTFRGLCVGATPIHRRRLRIRHAAAPGIAFHTVKCRAAGDVPAQGGIPALTRPPGGGTLVLTSENVCAASSLPEMRKGRICGIFSIPRCGWICRNFAFLRCGRVCGNDFSFSAKCRSGPIRTPRMDSRVVLQHNH